MRRVGHATLETGENAIALPFQATNQTRATRCRCDGSIQTFARVPSFQNTNQNHCAVRAGGNLVASAAQNPKKEIVWAVARVFRGGRDGVAFKAPAHVREARGRRHSHR